MRKIEKKMIEAFSNGKDYRKDNTSVCSYPNDKTFRVYLHGHLIVEKQDNELVLDDCDYQTKTTKSRLNCILLHYNLPTIYSKKFQWYLGGSLTTIGDEEWNGSKTFELQNND